MNKTIQDELKKYYKEIEDNLLCDRKQKKVFLTDIKSDIEDFLSANESPSIDGIIANFGTPTQIAESFLTMQEVGSIKKKMNLRRILLFAVTAVLFIYLAFVVISLIDVHTEAFGYFKETIACIRPILKGGILQ